MLLGHKCQGEATDRQNLEGWKEGRKEGKGRKEGILLEKSIFSYKIAN
jgi:hypothetical protein